MLARMIANGQPSLTALTAAAARAAHLIVDDEPVIFADTLAEAMLGERAEEFIAYHRAHGTHPVLAGARAQVTCRSRYAEDSLARGIERGTDQYVLLGAGLDSFAYRSPLADQARVFEVDHPATQAHKRRVTGTVAGQVRAVTGGAGGMASGVRAVTGGAGGMASGVRAATGGAGGVASDVRAVTGSAGGVANGVRAVTGGTGADGVTFVPVDFARDSLAEALGRAGFDASRPAFVSWLGVTMYLDSSAIEATVSVLGGFAPGSEIVVDYMLPAGLRDTAGQAYADLVGQVAAERGEPWRSFFAPEAMADLLARHGFGPTRDVGQRDMIPAAAWDRSDALRPAELSHIAHAAIG
jgi:O-methyltransferase involved in polyketide biosynthesis